MSAKTFSVYLNGKLIERLEGSGSDTPATIRRRLVDCEYYDPRIKVCAAREARTQNEKTRQ